MTIPKRNTVASTIILYVNLVGLWRGNQGKNKHWLAIVAMFCYFSTYVCQIAALGMSKDDIERLFECFSVISFSGMGILKLFSLTRKCERWLTILDQMMRLEQEQLKDNEDLGAAEYQSNDEERTHVARLIKKYTDNYKRTSTILLRMYYFTAVIFIISPFVEYGFMVFFGKKLQGYPHILPSWNPLDDIHIIYYVLTVIAETVAAVYCVSVHTAFDLTVIGVMIFISGQFSALMYQSERIGGKGNICNISKNRDARAHYRVKKCHHVHIQLIRLISDLDYLLKNILGVYFFLATLTLCTVAVRLKTEQMSVMQLLSLLQYICGTLTQLYVYCSYGDAVYHKSSVSIGRGPFGAAIWCISPRVRREIALLGFGMMRPRKFHAGPFNTVDLPSFIQIIRAAYSYYAVLGKSKQN